MHCDHQTCSGHGVKSQHKQHAKLAEYRVDRCDAAVMVVAAQTSASYVQRVLRPLLQHIPTARWTFGKMNGRWKTPELHCCVLEIGMDLKFWRVSLT